MFQGGQVPRQESAARAEPSLAELLDPAALEARLVEARARRAEAIARRAGGKAAEHSPPVRRLPPGRPTFEQAALGRSAIVEDLAVERFSPLPPLSASLAGDRGWPDDIVVPRAEPDLPRPRASRIATAVEPARRDASPRRAGVAEAPSASGAATAGPLFRGDGALARVCGRRCRSVRGAGDGAAVALGMGRRAHRAAKSLGVRGRRRHVAAGNPERQWHRSVPQSRHHRQLRPPLADTGPTRDRTLRPVAVALRHCAT